MTVIICFVALTIKHFSKYVFQQAAERLARVQYSEMGNQNGRTVTVDLVSCISLVNDCYAGFIAQLPLPWTSCLAIRHTCNFAFRLLHAEPNIVEIFRKLAVGGQALNPF